MSTYTPSRSLVVQQVVLSTAMIGITIVFILMGRRPGWQAYAVIGLLAISFLVASLVMWQGSNWLGIVALAVLLLAMLWKTERPLSAVAGLVLSILGALNAYRKKREAEEQAASALLQPEQGEGTVPSAEG